MGIGDKSIDQIKYYLSFIGWGRSGNSLVGALLDFHPNVYVKNEFFPLQERFKTQEQIFKKILEKIERKRKKGTTQKWGGFDHGTFEDMYKGVPFVVGGKKGGFTSNKLIDEPEFFTKVYDEIIKVPVKWLHIQRNPFDNISSFRKIKSIERGIELYFKHAQAVKQVLESDRDCLTVRQEDLIANTKREVQRMCDHMDIETYPKYLNHCRKVVWKKPNKSRFKKKWSNKNIRIVEEKMKEYEFMRGYTYGDI
jgi:hypothetical protein